MLVPAAAAVLTAALIVGCGDGDEPTGPAPDQWYTEAVDTAGRTGLFTSIAVDGSDRPHLVYYNEFGPDNLKYAHYDGAQWQFAVIDANTATSDLAPPVILVDRAGGSHVAFIDQTADEVRYASELVNGWQVETVDGAGERFCALSMTSTADGVPVISYGKTISDSVAGLWLAVLDVQADAWEIAAIDSGAAIVASSAAIDSQGLCHVAYIGNAGYPGFDLYYAVGSPGAWAIDTVVGDTTAWYQCSLGVTPDGEPQIAFNSVDPAGMAYAVKTETGWSIEVIDGAALGPAPEMRTPDGEQLSLRLDAGGVPHLAYWSWADSSLVYAVRGTGWAAERADNSGSVGAYCSLALDHQGRPHIAYQDRDRADLKYAIKR